jgi:hypothetical protein
VTNTAAYFAVASTTLKKPFSTRLPSDKHSSLFFIASMTLNKPSTLGFSATNTLAYFVITSEAL